MEVLACIKFLANILEGKKVHSVEFRTDCDATVGFIEGKWFEYLYNGVRGEIYVNAIRKAATYWYRLYNMIKQSNCRIEIKRVERNYKKMKIVDKYAKEAMAKYDGNPICLFKTANASDFTVLKDKDIQEYNDVPEVWLDTLSREIWYENQLVSLLPVQNIKLVEDIHLNAGNLELRNRLKELYINKQDINTPIAVRRLPEGNYGLVVGLERFCIAKICDIEMIPAVLTEMNHIEFSLKYGLSM